MGCIAYFKIILHCTSLISPLFIEMPVPSNASESSCVRAIECAYFYYLCVGFCKCSECVGFFVFHFILFVLKVHLSTHTKQTTVYYCYRYNIQCMQYILLNNIGAYTDYDD